MKFNLTLLAAAALLAAACAPKAGKTTKVVGQFAENAPETVRIVLGESVDTTVTVTDGRFEVVIPTDLCDVAYVETDYMPVSFIADGSKITVDPMAGTAVSSNKKGAQAHYAAYNAWMEQFMADYRAKMAEFGEDEEAAQKYFDEVVEKFNAYQKETAKANLDNIVGLMAISEIMDDDTEELKALLDGLSDEMKARPEVARMIASVRNQEDATDVIDELIDRFGEPPKAVLGLITVSQLRSAAAEAGIHEIRQSGEKYMLYSKKLDLEVFAKLSEKLPHRVTIIDKNPPYIAVKVNTKVSAAENMEEILSAIQS